MSVHLIGVTSQGGLPVCSRHFSNSSSSSSIPFQTLAALNGVNLFSRLNNANLLETSTKDTKIHWKVFRGSITLILISSDPDNSNDMLNQVLDRIFDGLVLMCGVNEVVGQNIERLKRSLRSAFPLIDYFLELICSENSFSLLTQSMEYYLTTDHHLIEFMNSLVESYAQVASSSFACLFAKNTLVAASKSWWNKLNHTKDVLLIKWLVDSIPPNELLAPKVIPVYLPENCPNSITRIIVVQIFDSCNLVVLCGETPSLEYLETEAINSVKASQIHQEQFKKLIGIDHGFGLNINEQLKNFVFIKDDLKLITFYGCFDERKYRDLKKSIIMSQSSGVGINNKKTAEFYFKFQNYQIFYYYHNHCHLHSIFPLDLPLNSLKTISLKTMNTLLKDNKKMWP